METKRFSEQIDAMVAENEFLRESYASMAQAVLAFEDNGWNPAGNPSVEGFALAELQDAASKIRETAEGNPLLKRGSALRNSYIFGKGVGFRQQPPRIQRIIDLPKNQDVLFSAEAQVTNERCHFTDGQFFVLGNVADKTFQRIPFNEITAVVTAPDDAEEVLYYRRSWTRKSQDLSSSSASSQLLQVWYPADTYTPTNGRFVPRIDNLPVDTKYKMFASKVNRRSGQIWGVPDAFPALPWAHAYNEYLKDGSRMLKALSMFAWQLKSKTRSGATNAAASIATPATSGSTAVLGADMELSSLPRTGGTIDLTNGRPLASMVATALEVSVVALLSDPGSSGAYGTAQTLDVPTLKAMESRQHVWTSFYKRISLCMGARAQDIESNWPKIETESSQRLTQALALAYESGAIWQDEYRESIIETLDVPKLHSTPPVPEGQAPAQSGSAIPSQGNSGAVGSMQDNSNDLRDADNAPIA